MAFIEFQDVRKVYHMGSVDVTAVDGMTFSVEKGELCVIVGPSGALDYQTGKQILELLQDTCHETGQPVCIVTHNLAFTQIADRVIHVREGRASKIEVNSHPASAATVEW